MTVQVRGWQTLLNRIGGGRRTSFTELGKEKVTEIFRLAVQQDTNRAIPQLTRARGPGRRGQPVRYNGRDPRLEHGKTYDSFAHVVRSSGRPDLERRLYDGRQRVSALVAVVVVRQLHDSTDARAAGRIRRRTARVTRRVALP